MNRRDFLEVALGPLVAPLADDPLADLKKYTVTRITGFRHTATRPRVAGKSARRDVDGAAVTEDVLRIMTNVGVEGFGFGTTTPADARSLIGRSLDEFRKTGLGIVSPLGRADHALYDLVGKALALPTWKILGGAGRESVPVLDGSFYFNDLLPESEGRSGVPRLLHEVEQSLKSGHGALLIQVGRGIRWMEPEAGFRRDVEVVKAVSKLAGKKINLVADAGGAFDLESTERFLDAVGDVLVIVSELFPAQVERNLIFKDYLAKKGYKTLVAGGASARDLTDYNALIAHKAIDVYQPDIRVFGMTRACALARRLSLEPSLRLAPRGWGSFLGLTMQLVIARAVPNFLIAEQDPCVSDLFDASAFKLAEGKIRAPDVPGCGLTLVEDMFQAKYAKDAWSVGQER